MSELTNYNDRKLIDKEISLLIERDNLLNDTSIKKWLKTNWKEGEYGEEILSDPEEINTMVNPKSVYSTFSI